MSTSVEEILSRSPEETHEVARRVLERLPTCAVLALHGDLGSGKTCFVQGLALALGVRQAVTSPTFTLMHEYRCGRRLTHMDLYRVRSADEAWVLGLEDCLEREGITVIEWAERAAEMLPPHTVHVDFEVGAGEEERRIRVRGLEKRL